MATATNTAAKRQDSGQTSPQFGLKTALMLDPGHIYVEAVGRFVAPGTGMAFAVGRAPDLLDHEYLATVPRHARYPDVVDMVARGFTWRS